jgi:flagellin
MSLTLNTNVSSLNTQNWLTTNSTTLSKATQQLSSGSQLNSSADDPAGYAISFSLGTKAAVLQTAINNANQGTAMLQVAQGAMQQIGNILTQLKQIAAEAASANDGSNLTSLDNERTALQTQIDNINTSTKYSNTSVFGGAGNTYTATDTPSTGLAGVDVSGYTGPSTDKYILSYASNSVTMTQETSAGTPTGASQAVSVTAPTGLNTTNLNFSAFGINLTVNANVASLAGTIQVTSGAGALTFQVGDVSNAANRVSLTLGNVNSATLGLTGDLTSAANAQAYMGVVDTAINNLNTDEGNVGDAMDQLSYQTANLQTMQTNTQSAESTIKDTNYASAMSTFTSAQIATQADVAMLTQANSLPQQILSLIKG